MIAENRSDWIFFTGIFLSVIGVFATYFSIEFGFFILSLGLIVLITLSIYQKNTALLVMFVSILIYCAVPPYFHFVSDFGFWGVGGLPADWYAHSLSLVYIYIFSICSGYTLGRITKNLKREYISEYVHNHKFLANPLSQHVCLGVYLLWVVILSAYIASRPDLNMVDRALQVDVADRAMEIFFATYLPKVMLLTVVCAIFLTALNYSYFYRIFLFAFCFIAVIIFVSPSSTARQIIIVGLLPLILYVFRDRLIVVTAVLIVGIIGLGPLFNYFARDGFYQVETEVFPFSPDFDAFYIGALVVGQDYLIPVGYGRYFLSAVSFFLPRDLKMFVDFDPLQLAPGSVLSQTNVSLPPFFTIYLDFGFFGVFLLGVISGMILYLLDGVIKFSAKIPTVKLMIAFSVVSAIPPFVRGPLLGWGPFFLSGIISALLVFGVFTFFRSGRIV